VAGTPSLFRETRFGSLHDNAKTVIEIHSSTTWRFGELLILVGKNITPIMGVVSLCVISTK